MLAYLSALFIVLVALALFVVRRQMAEAQAAVIGGSVPPGCVVAEVIALVAIALTIALAQAFQLV